jgi:hypothetical protein
MSTNPAPTGADKGTDTAPAAGKLDGNDLESLLSTLVSQLKNSDWVAKQQEIAKSEGRKSMWEEVAELEKEELAKEDEAKKADATSGAGEAKRSE